MHISIKVPLNVWDFFFVPYQNGYYSFVLDLCIKSLFPIFIGGKTILAYYTKATNNDFNGRFKASAEERLRRWTLIKCPIAN